MNEPRDAALTALYAIDLSGEPIPSDLVDKASRLVRGVTEHLPELDERINAVAEGWRTERMPAIDRAILRMATYELVYEADTPAPIVLSEAVRLAKLYSTEKSGGFVNGVLAKLADTQSA